jgi:chemotaxis regulatin CheY-phosphate phosphatase CheZ
MMREASQRVFTVLQQTATASVRQLARLTGLPRSSVHRYKAGIIRRNQYPESHLWERPEGYRWLCVLVYATVFVFGIMRGVGAETLSLFFRRLHLQRWIAVSPTAIREVRRRMEGHILASQREQEQAIRQEPTGIREVCLAADETFFQEVVLLFMDISSGYIFVEASAPDRTYAPWSERVQTVVQAFGLKVRYLVRDRARALIKLADEGLAWASIPDLFHTMRELTILLGGRLQRRLQRVQTQLATSTATLAALVQVAPTAPKIDALSREIEELIQERGHLRVGIQIVPMLLHRISCLVHPFRVGSPTQPTTAPQVMEGLNEMAQAFRDLIADDGIVDSRHRLDRFTRQSQELVRLLDLWWLWVEEELMAASLDETHRDWLRRLVLPAVYWHGLADKTTQPFLPMRSQRAADTALAAVHQHPLTLQMPPAAVVAWQEWATWMAAKFQRASSVVEGRNGYLAQVHHTGRGFPAARLNALTVIHNFGLTRPDGTTAAQRLLGRPFPDLFHWLVTHMGDLPLPRSTDVSPNPKRLNLLPVPP